MMRIGNGFDVHSFGGSGPLIIGGVHIPFKYGFISHSDGDVVLHSIIDALLGAIAMGDIGQLFPDNDPDFKGSNSMDLLDITWQHVKKKGYVIGNIDVTIFAQEPKILFYSPKICDNISKILNCYSNDISVKATTTEHLGFIGRVEGIACQAIVLLLMPKFKTSTFTKSINH